MENFSPSCERNKQVIWQQLDALLKQQATIFEIGSLSGQHALHFTRQRDDIVWHCSDIEENLQPLTHNITTYGINNVALPKVLDLTNTDSWQHGEFDYLFSANTLHIVAKPLVENFFKAAEVLVKQDGQLLIYGPFKYQGKYTSDSNAEFQQWLLERDPQSGIRDFEWIEDLAHSAGFALSQDIAMPANNQLLVFRRD